jgi:hypothetical protein
MRRSTLAAALAPVLAFAAITFGSTREAAAGPVVDLDLHLGTAFQSDGVSRIDFSLGGGVNVGYRFNFPHTIVYLQPEIGGHYMRFGFNADAAGYDYAGILNAGVKVGLQGIVQPNAFAHVGLGIMGWSDPYGGALGGQLGPEFDLGLGLDFKIARNFTLGANIAYNSVVMTDAAGPAAAKWLSFGIKAAFLFGEPAAHVRVRRVRYY